MLTILRAIGEAVTPVMLVLAVAAGAFSYYWDASMFLNKGLETEARVARAVGVSLMIAGVVFYLIGAVGRLIA